MKPFKALAQAIARIFSRTKPYDPLPMHGKPPSRVENKFPTKIDFSKPPVVDKPTLAEVRSVRRINPEDHIVQRRAETGTATGRLSSVSAVKTPRIVEEEDNAQIERERQRQARLRRQREEEEETRRRNASSYTQNSPAFTSAVYDTPQPERYTPPAPAYAGGGGSFDGGGSSGDWSSPSCDSGSSSSDSGSSSCDSGSSSSGCD